MSLVDALNALRQADGKNVAAGPPLPFQLVKAGLNRKLAAPMKAWPLRLRNAARGPEFGDISQIGRTSIAPNCAPGQRAAQEIAASRSGASMRK